MAALVPIPLMLKRSLAMARRAVQPEVGQGQVHALGICCLLTKWFAKGNNHRVSFIHVPSGIHWHPHDEAHHLARKLTVPIGRRMATTLSWLRREVDTKCKQAWINSFRSPKVQGHNYLALQSLKRADVTPSAVKGGPWITRFGESPQLMARAVRCITNHAPIGAYYERFNIPEPTACPCGASRMTRWHILAACRLHARKSMPSTLHGMLAFLKDNPGAFSYTQTRPRAREG
ncbi:hypothetical protein CVT24_002484 [Panaeolus cyanescens]|uniref:Uncharacterized protein n=1 Tax=Panaeolus cyanescens TaxID=181874 RepID=A0A409YY56_9AGAR|nr:hypothetical protein CVT24_002484 [Panaeolus cyanescens]